MRGTRDVRHERTRGCEGRGTGGMRGTRGMRDVRGRGMRGTNVRDEGGGMRDER